MSVRVRPASLSWRASLVRVLGELLLKDLGDSFVFYLVAGAFLIGIDARHGNAVAQTSAAAVIVEAFDQLDEVTPVGRYVGVKGVAIIDPPMATLCAICTRCMVSVPDCAM